VFAVRFGAQSGFALCPQRGPGVVKAPFAEAGMGVKAERRITRYNCGAEEPLPFCFGRSTVFDKEL